MDINIEAYRSRIGRFTTSSLLATDQRILERKPTNPVQNIVIV